MGPVVGPAHVLFCSASRVRVRVRVLSFRARSSRLRPRPSQARPRPGQPTATAHACYTVCTPLRLRLGPMGPRGDRPRGEPRGLTADRRRPRVGEWGRPGHRGAAPRRQRFWRPAGPAPMSPTSPAPPPPPQHPSPVTPSPSHVQGHGCRVQLARRQAAALAHRGGWARRHRPIVAPLPGPATVTSSPLPALPRGPRSMAARPRQALCRPPWRKAGTSPSSSTSHSAVKGAAALLPSAPWPPWPATGASPPSPPPSPAAAGGACPRLMLTWDGHGVPSYSVPPASPRAASSGARTVDRPPRQHHRDPVTPHGNHDRPIGFT